MTLYFVRHAEADPDRSADFERRLTAKGREQAERVGKFCRRHELFPELLITSPVVRAKETAEILTKNIGEDIQIVESRVLACGMSPDELVGELTAYARFSRVMLTGHEPDFSRAIAYFLGMTSPEAIKVRKASLTCLELPRIAAGAGQLQFFLPARLAT